MGTNLDTSLLTSFERIREQTHEIATLADDDIFRCQVHPEYSPVGWHVGHIGFTEARWVLEECKGDPPLSAEFNWFFSPMENPKPNRTNLPPREEVYDYLEKVRTRSLEFLFAPSRRAPAHLLRDGFVVRFLVQHECMHLETIALVLNMAPPGTGAGRGAAVSPDAPSREMVSVRGEPFPLGKEADGDWLDNEVPCHWTPVSDFEIDVYPVTNAQYLAFLEDGGYREPRWWSPAGWRWRCDNDITTPRAWRRDSAGWCRTDLFGRGAVRGTHPVTGVSWYEADAYARWAGKRLPTESEWELAASWHPSARRKRAYSWGDTPPHEALCNSAFRARWTTPVGSHPRGASPWGCQDMNGNVWEWTSSAFAPYPGFRAYPYDEYSQPFFDGEHYVLRGGSWASPGPIVRNTFRNWYTPWCREIFAGFRCARDAA